MKRILIAIIFFVTVFSLPITASAQLYEETYWWNYIQNQYGGIKGVASDFHVLQRHEGVENNVCVVDGKGGPSQTYTGFGWQITDAVYWPVDRFDCNLHVVWPSGDHSYYDYVGPLPLPQGQYHRLKTEYQGNGVWYLFLNGTHVVTCNWPYYSSNTKAKTQLETYNYDNPNSFMGHAYNVWAKNASSVWSQQTTVWSCSSGLGTTFLANPYTKYNYSDYKGVYIWSKFWDWEARKP